jgi:predicted PurR-regulated permease PerM
MEGGEAGSAMTRERLFAAFFFVAFLFLIYQLTLFLAPFAAPLVLAAVLVLTFYPLTERVVKLLRGSRTGAALAMSLGVVALVLVPTALLVSLLIEEAAGAYNRIQELVPEGAASPLAASETWLGATWRGLLERFPLLSSLDLSSVTLEASKRVSGWVATHATLLAQNVVLSAFNTSMMLVALFFFFRDGERIAGLLRDLIPMEAAYKDRILKRLYDTVTAVVQSTVLIAVIQGIVAGLGYAVIGRLSVSVLLGFVTGVASLIPMVGATLIWLPAALYVMVTGELWRGVALLLWGAVAVGSVDNFVRPLVIGGRVQIPTLLLLFALLGGLQVYGFLGIFVAPVVVATLLAFVSIYREHYVDAEPSAAPDDPDA